MSFDGWQDLLKFISVQEQYRKVDIACYKSQNLQTSWRAIVKHKETNKQIRFMKSSWQKVHRTGNTNIKSLNTEFATMAQRLLELKLCTTANHEEKTNTNDEDECIYSAKHQEILFKHDAVPLYICSQNETEYTKLGTGELVVIYNKQRDTAQIMLLADNKCLLKQIMCNVLQMCTYNQVERCIDWIGNNHANRCDSSEIIKCRVYFTNKIGKQLVLKFLESYNTCWNDHGSKCIQHIQINSVEMHPKRPIEPISFNITTATDINSKELEREAVVNVVSMHSLCAQINRMCLQTPILHMTYQYECVLISLRHKVRHNLFESDVIPRCVPNNVIVHQLRGSKAIRRLYKRPTINSEHNDIEHRPIFDDFILHKNDDRVSALLPDVLCVAHSMPTYFTFSTLKVKSYCYLLDYFVFGDHSELFAANMRCFVQLICYSKTAHLCSKCVLKYVQRSDGLNQMFGFIQQFINTLAQSDITKIVKEIYGVIAVIRMLSNLLLYPLVIRYMFSVSTFYRKLFRFWMALTRFIWNFKSTKHKLEHIPLDQHLIDMIIVMIKASKFDTVDESAVTLIAINNDSIHLFELLLDLMVHILNDFIYVSTRYWRKRHFKYVLKHARIVLFLVDWFKNEFEAKHHQFSQANLKKQYHIRGLKQYCNGNMVESVRIAFEKGLLNAFQTISCDSEYILKLRQVIAWYIAKKTNVNNLNAWNVLPVNRLNGSSGKAQQLFWKAVHLQYKCEIATMDINAYQKMKITFVGRYKKCQHCETIKQDTDQWYVCNGCRFVFYCSRRCQKVDWNQNNHRRLCNVLRTYPHNISALGLSTNL
eukprot:43764_1